MSARAVFDSRGQCESVKTPDWLDLEQGQRTGSFIPSQTETDDD